MKWLYLLLVPPAAMLLYLLWGAIFALFVDRTRMYDDFSPSADLWIRCADRIVLFFTRTRISAEGFDALPDGPFLLVCNHRSALDPIAALRVLGDRRIVFVSKPEILRIPVVGRILHRNRFLSIDRENARRALDTLNAAAALLREGVCVGIYPEGTRSHDGTLLPLHSGVFRIAQSAGVPIVVAHIRGTEAISHRAPWQKTPVFLRVLAVIPAEELSAARPAAVSARVLSLWEGAQSDPPEADGVRSLHA